MYRRNTKSKTKTFVPLSAQALESNAITPDSLLNERFHPLRDIGHRAGSVWLEARDGASGALVVIRRMAPGMSIGDEKVRWGAGHYGLSRQYGFPDESLIEFFESLYVSLYVDIS